MWNYDHRTGKVSKLQDIKLRGSPKILRKNFEVKELLVSSHDGEEVPMTLFYQKVAVELNRRNRVLLESYGTYGISME